MLSLVDTDCIISGGGVSQKSDNMNHNISNIAAHYKHQLLQAFPKELAQDVQSVIEILPFNPQFSISIQMYTVILETEKVTVPYRVYFEEPDPKNENALTNIQRRILHCIYLRHHNGFVRQRRLEQLNNTMDIWEMPFKFNLLGEYVLEILIVLNQQIKNSDIKFYCKFMNLNPTYWELTKQRIASYWNVYYRGPKFPKLSAYLGSQIVERLEKPNMYQKP